ncbi:unnamed protein product [Spirodela intermedia]|uniref:B box-type domain-containing protein n=1 Tax=Spirodela intermedia TaxID=51605 RepID=A0A7I8JM12_SPIIN|nr:unnamed protein product [Spirodela intermedia]CAA6671140.1 unnamed protein product [Spirodela intermedia]
MEARRACELCEGEAAVHCESDSAFLCWACDAAVHGANFLVARHRRRSRCRNAAPLTSLTRGPSLGPPSSPSSSSATPATPSRRTTPRSRIPILSRLRARRPRCALPPLPPTSPALNLERR